MKESTKSHPIRILRGDYERFIKPGMIGIDVSGGDDPLRNPSGEPYPVYDINQNNAQYLEGIATESLDFIYACHCLEHLRNLDIALSNWNRVLKRGGYAYITVPDFILYEHHNWPSKYNGDHKHTFSLSLSRKFVGRDDHFGPQELSDLFKRAGFKIVRMELEDQDFDYSDTSGEDQTTGQACAQINIVLKKPTDSEFLPGVLRASGKKEEYSDFIRDFPAGLGDVINTIYKTKNYTILDTITKKTHVVIRSHNPFIEELFLNHPKRHLMIINNITYLEPRNVNYMYHNVEYGRELYNRLGLDASKAIRSSFVDEPVFTQDQLEKPVFYCSKEDQALLQSIKLTGKKYVVFQPGAGTPNRNLPENVVLSAIDYFISKDYLVVIIGKSYTRALKSGAELVRNVEHEKESFPFLVKLKGNSNVIDLVDTSITVPGTIELVKNSNFFFGSHSSMNLVAWYNRIPNVILYDGITKKNHFERVDQWSFGQVYKETRHGLFQDYDNSWIEEIGV
jgi:predicted SAM-dependent methyltransferase